MTLKRPSFEWLVAALATAVVTLCSAAVHGWFLRNSLASIGADEGHIVAFAERLITHHWLPYVDAVCHRAPLLYWFMAVLQQIFGLHSWVGIRVGTLILAMLAAISCFLTGAAARRPLAGAVAAAFYAYVTLFAVDIGAGISLQGEHVAVPFALGSVAFVALAINYAPSEKRRLLCLFASGASASIATLAKQTSLLLIVPLPIWIVAWSFTAEEASRRLALRRMGALFAGWAIPMVLVVALYAALGQLSTFFYWVYTFNKDVYMGPYNGQSLVNATVRWARDKQFVALGLILVLGGSFARLVFDLDSLKPRELLRAYARVGFEATTAILGTLMVMTAFATMRFWPHYFTVALPWIGMAIGLPAERALSMSPALGRRLGYAGMSLLAATVAVLAASQRLEPIMAEKRRGYWTPGHEDAICEAVDRYTKPDEAIFVWGFAADLYISCRRNSVTRYVTPHFVAGIVPPFWNRAKKAYVGRDAREIVASEVESARPPLILDEPSMFHGFGVKRVPELARIIKRDYCKVGKVKGRAGRSADFYLRKDRPECGGGQAQAPP